MAKMMVYAWFDKGHGLQETKFGDHFVPTNLTAEEAEQHTIDYMRTQFPRRGRYFDSDSVIKKVWDISENAKKANKFAKGSHIDDYIGDSIGRRGTKQGREFHKYNFDEFEYRVNDYIRKSNQPLPSVGLAQWQYDAAENVLSAQQNGASVIMAELCARFGKTIWSGALAVESGAKITIVASYVLTSFASFAKDLTAFEQFRDLVVVDTAQEDYQEKIKAALKEGRQVVAFLSMCGSSKRQDRIDFLFGLKESRMVFIDEADFGAHTANQADPFIQAKKSKDLVVLMTGTNGEKACGSWKIDHYLGTTYAELLMYKEGI